MKFLKKYEEIGIQTEKEVFDFLMDNMKETIRTYDFFVAWEKVLGHAANVEIPLNLLNSLIGKSNIEEEMKFLIQQYPEVVPVLPLLIAVRGTSILVAGFGGDIEYSFARKKVYSAEEIDKIVEFSTRCGLTKLLAERKIKNLVDYCIGVEVGLDTNARKNRSGTAMEHLTEVYVKAICDKHGYRYFAQATVAKIKEEFGIDVPTDKADRHFDFAVFTGKKIYLMEVNYYGGGGSKLKSVAGEFKSLFELVTSKPDIGFVWISDGQGWHTAQRPLMETFQATDYVFNIKMIEQGLLEEVIIKGL